jgi:hypothetical protein
MGAFLLNEKAGAQLLEPLYIIGLAILSASARRLNYSPNTKGLLLETFLLRARVVRRVVVGNQADFAVCKLLALSSSFSSCAISFLASFSAR